MGTYTDNLALYKPAIGESGWGTLVNASFDQLDTSIPAGPLTRYVDYQNGDDVNTGMSPGAAYRTIQAAYDELKAYAIAHYTPVGTSMPGVGRIVLLPGNHDVGAGLNLDAKNPPELIGFRSALYYVNATTASTVVTSSSSADYLVKIEPATGTLGSGGRFYDVQFNVTSSTNTALTKCIYSKGVNSLHVERCGFRNLSGTAINVTCIYQESLGDCSYGRIRNNNSGHMQLYRAAVGTNNTNFNRNCIHENQVFYSGSLPSVQLTAEWFEGSVSFNDFSGTACAIELGGTDQSQTDRNVFVQNSGESPDSTNPYYRFVSHANGTSGPTHNIILGGSCSCLAGEKGTWVDFGAGAMGNMVIGACDYVGINGMKAKVVDASPRLDNLLMNAAYGHTIRYEAGASPSITDGDFVSSPSPWNGTLAVTHNTGSGEDRLWVRMNGAWKSVVLS